MKIHNAKPKLLSENSAYPKSDDLVPCPQTITYSCFALHKETFVRNPVVSLPLF